ncbi:MAG: PAC2 family protein [Candidatus Woesearchaeota archaeon]
MEWEITEVGKVPKLNGAVLISGLPGIGNVGKVAVDFLIDELKAKKVYTFFSYSFPHSVFVNEENLVDLPSIELYYATGKYPLLLLAGDIQPTDEISSYEFSDEVLRLAKKLGAAEVITLGGIGLPTVPKEPKIYCTGNSKKMVDKYKDGATTGLFGVVGPIIGVSGLLLGLAKRQDLPAVSFLAETYGHPMYIGVRGAKEILELLNKKLGLKLDLAKMEREIEDMEGKISKGSKKLKDIARQSALQKMKKFGSETSYIG